jgi:phosphocarrier protein HPr
MPESSEQAITLSGDLHARPAGQLAVAAAKFTADVTLTAGERSANAKSVLAVMGLGATTGQQITAAATGPDAEQAVAAVIAILADATAVGG